MILSNSHIDKICSNWELKILSVIAASGWSIPVGIKCKKPLFILFIYQEN